MQIEMLVQLSEVGPKVGDVVEEDKARAVALVQAGYARFLPEEGEPEEAEPEAEPLFDFEPEFEPEDAEPAE